jgi:MTH538 TIR-like domain (DUF1863)
MARRIFISYQHDDRNQAKGFHLLKWNKNVDVEFVGRHLLDPVDSNNESYISSKIQEQLKGSSVTVVLIGEKTHQSEWVQYEIESSLKKENPNGILAIRLPDGGSLPVDSPVGKTLHDAGAEIIDWDPHKFAEAIERAAKAAGRVQAIQAAGVSSGGTGCSR